MNGQSCYPWNTCAGDQLWQCRGLLGLIGVASNNLPWLALLQQWVLKNRFGIAVELWLMASSTWRWVWKNKSYKNNYRLLSHQLDTNSWFNRWWYISAHACISSEFRQDLDAQLEDSQVSGDSCEVLAVRIWAFKIHYLKSSSPYYY